MVTPKVKDISTDPNDKIKFIFLIIVSRHSALIGIFPANKF